MEPWLVARAARHGATKTQVDDGNGGKREETDSEFRARVIALPSCPQCGGPMPSPVRSRIRENRAWRDLVFCSGQCATHYQMGCEG